MNREVKCVPSVKCGELTSPDGEKFDLFPAVIIPTENSRGDLLVLCRGSKAAAEHVPCNPQSLADALKQMLGVGEEIEVEVKGPFKVPVGSSLGDALRNLEAGVVKAAGCGTGECEPAKPDTAKPAKPKRPARPRKAAAKKPARRRR